MAYVWNPSNNSALRFSIDLNEIGNIAQEGETPAGTKSKSADIFNTSVTADDAVTIGGVFATLFGFTQNSSAITKTDTSKIDVE